MGKEAEHRYRRHRDELCWDLMEPHNLNQECQADRAKDQIPYPHRQEPCEIPQDPAARFEHESSV